MHQSEGAGGKRPRRHWRNTAVFLGCFVMGAVAGWIMIESGLEKSPLNPNDVSLIKNTFVWSILGAGVGLIGARYLRSRRPQELFDKGHALAGEGRTDEALAVYDTLVRRFGHSSKTAVKALVARAFMYKALVSKEKDKLAEAIEALDGVIRCVGDSPDPELQSRLISALFVKGCRLEGLGLLAEAAAVQDELIRRFGDSSHPRAKELVPHAFYSKGYLSGTSGGPPATVLANFDEFLRRFKEPPPSDPENTLRLVFWALHGKSIALLRTGRKAESLAVDDEIIRRIGDSSEPEQRSLALEVFLRRATSFEELGRLAEALEAQDDFIRRFGGASEPDLREPLIEALVAKHRLLLKLRRSQGEDRLLPSDAARIHDDALRIWDGFSTPGEHDPGSALARADPPREALAALDAFLQLFRDSPDADVQTQAASTLLDKALKRTRANRMAQAGGGAH